jgi:sulfite reductase (NADPH) hemoprotein beta-component
VGHCIRAGVGDGELLDYLESVLRVYNRHGRRDNKFKARIKILLNELGIEAFTAEVEAEFAARTAGERIALPQAEIERIRAFFAMPELTPTAHTPAYDTALAVRPAFARWARQNTFAHKVAGHAMVLISLKAPGDVPGDATAHQMEVVADLAERFGHGDIRVSHEQNLALPHVRREDLPVIFDTLQAAGLASANAGMITDIICCPGLDFCNLANTRSIPLAQEIALAFDGEMARTLGEVSLNMSGCINACGHHHVGHIGLLGVDRKGEEAYQISLGGRSDRNARIGEITGPALARAEVVPALRRVLDTYLSVRERAGERFIDTLERLGETPFREAIHADHPAHS